MGKDVLNLTYKDIDKYVALRNCCTVELVGSATVLLIATITAASKMAAFDTVD
jgi:hypothetical protein